MGRGPRNCGKTQYTFQKKRGPKSCETKALFGSVKWLFLWSWSFSWVNAIALFDLKTPQNLWEQEMWLGHLFFSLSAVAEAVIDLKSLSGWSHLWVSCLTWGQGAEHTHPLQHSQQLVLRQQFCQFRGVHQGWTVNSPPPIPQNSLRRISKCTRQGVSTCPSSKSRLHACGLGTVFCAFLSCEHWGALKCYSPSEAQLYILTLKQKSK